MSNFMTKVLHFVGFDTPEDTYDDFYAQEQPEIEQDTIRADFDDTPAFERFASRRSSRVVKMHESTGSQNMRVLVVSPASLDEAKHITNHLKESKTIIVKLDNVENGAAQRIVDCLSGAVYALDGDIQKIANGIFLITPRNVGIYGKDLAEKGFIWGN